MMTYTKLCVVNLVTYQIRNLFKASEFKGTYGTFMDKQMGQQTDRQAQSTCISNPVADSHIRKGLMLSICFNATLEVTVL